MIKLRNDYTHVQKVMSEYRVSSWQKIPSHNFETTNKTHKNTCTFCALNRVFPLTRWNGIRRVSSHSEYSTDGIRTSRHMNTSALHFHINFGTSVCNLFFGRTHFVSTVNTISDNSVDGAHTGNIISCAYSLAQKPVPNLPGKHCWVRTLVVGDLVDDGTCCYLRLTSPDYAGPDGASLVESA